MRLLLLLLSLFQSMSVSFIVLITVCIYFSVKFLYLDCVECVYDLYIQM